MYEIINLNPSAPEYEYVSYEIIEYESLFDEAEDLIGGHSAILTIASTDTAYNPVGQVYYNTFILIDNNTMRSYYRLELPYPDGDGDLELDNFNDISGTRYMPFSRIE